MGNVKVRVNISNIARGPSHEKSVVYKKGQEFICPESEAAKLGKDVTIIEKIAEPEKTKSR